jgi:hypothetical protein
MESTVYEGSRKISVARRLGTRGSRGGAHGHVWGLRGRAPVPGWFRCHPCGRWTPDHGSSALASANCLQYPPPCRPAARSATPEEAAPPWALAPEENYDRHCCLNRRSWSLQPNMNKLSPFAMAVSSWSGKIWKCKLSMSGLAVGKQFGSRRATTLHLRESRVRLGRMRPCPSRLDNFYLGRARMHVLSVATAKPAQN